KPIHTTKKVDISNCPFKNYENPEENIDAMRFAIDDDFVKVMPQEIFEITCKIFDIIENAGHNKFIGYKLACHIYVINQEIKTLNSKEVKRGNGPIVKKLYRNISQPVAQKEIAYLNSKPTNWAIYKTQIEKIKKQAAILTELKDCPNIITFSQKMPFTDVTNMSNLPERIWKNNERPQLIEGTPPEYEEIMTLGWSPHPIKRPTADVIYIKLKAISIN
ncbi:1430_t:CDS:2, partial [Gigaspora margarita]